MVSAEDFDISERFSEFFPDYYREEVTDVARQVGQRDTNEPRSLVVDVMDVYRFDPRLCNVVIGQPRVARDHAATALQQYDLPVEVDLSNVDIRFSNAPNRTELAAIRARHVGQLISVYGTVKNSGTPRTRPATAAYECQRCGTITRVEQELGSDELQEPPECLGCERQGPFVVDYERSEMRDVQTFLLEQRDASGADSDTESIVIRVTDALIQTVDVGDRVTVTGVVTMEQPGEFNDGTLRDKFLAATAIEEAEPYETLTITADDESRIESLAASTEPVEQIVASIAPTVYGHDQTKLGIALQLFGGVEKRLPGEERIRGDIHLLLVGDPGTAKSRLATYAARLAPRAILASGGESSQVGLTAATTPSAGTSDPWEVKGGALVLSDQGLAVIDNLDTLRPEAQTSVANVLEDQLVHVNKASVTESLRARASVLAAAQPKYGRFDQYEPIGDQIDLDPGLLSQFDLIVTVRDDPDQEHDSALADHVLDVSHAGELQSSGATAVADTVEATDPPIDPALLRKYIAHARRHYHPTLTDEAKTTIRDFWVDYRSRGADEDTPVPLTVRKLEAVVRLAEASARIRLSESVEAEDAKRATALVGETLRDIGIDPETGEHDADVVESGRPEVTRDKVKELIADIEGEYDEGAPINEVLDRAEQLGLPRSKTEHEIEKLRRSGDAYEPTTDHLRTV